MNHPPHHLLLRVAAAIALVLLLVVPFISWRLGAILWLWAMLFYVFKGVFAVLGRGGIGRGSDGDGGDGEN